MKKGNKIIVFGLMMALTASTVAYAATGPAYPEVPVSERTSNLAENQNFVNGGKLRGQDAMNGTYTYYDMYGNRLKNASLAGGATTNENGIAIWKGKAIDGNYNEVVQELMAEGYSNDYGWKQDPEKPVNYNGISNWYYGNIFSESASWRWLSDQDNIFSTKKAYCFNEYGYLYVNTITPDGFIVNERGQMITEDGMLIEHEHNALTHDKMLNGYLSSPIGKMREAYFTTCLTEDCGGECFTGAYDKRFPDRDSQYTYEENIRRRKENKENSSIYK